MNARFPKAGVVAALFCAATSATAYAQEQIGADLVARIIQGARCQEAAGQEDLIFNIKKLKDDERVGLGDALKTISGTESVCANLRKAAEALTVTYPPTAAPSPPAEPEFPTDSAQQIVANTLAEADRRTASLKFEVGPPPRNITKGREAGL